MRVNVGDTAPNVQLTTMNDTTVHMAELWQPNGVIVSFLRHFG
jgi:peroxiredoxin